MPQKREDPKESEDWEEQKEEVILRWNVEDQTETLKWEADKEDREPGNQLGKDSTVNDRTSHEG